MALQKAKGDEKQAERRHASSYTRLPLYIKSSNLTLQGTNSGLRALHGKRTSRFSRFIISPVGRLKWHIFRAGWESAPRSQRRLRAEGRSHGYSPRVTSPAGSHAQLGPRDHLLGPRLDAPPLPGGGCCPQSPADLPTLRPPAVASLLLPRQHRQGL